MWIYKSGLSADEFISSESIYTKKYLAELESEYKNVKDSPMPELSFSAFNEYFKSGNRLLYETVYFKRRQLLRDFALMTWLGKAGAKERLHNALLAVCNEMTWALPAHVANEPPETVIDLFAAETAQTITEILSLVGRQLDEKLYMRCVDEVKKRVLTPFISRAKPYGWERTHSNWCAVCGGCVGMVVLYLIQNDDEAKRLALGLSDVFENYCKSFSDDGACLEGLYYWNYGMMYYTAFLDLYKRRFGEGYPINAEKLKRMADFSHKCCITNGITVSFSDGYEHDKIYGGLSSYLTREYGAKMPPMEYMAYFKGDDCGRWLKAARDIAWFKESDGSGEENIIVLPTAQWAVIRNPRYAISFKGGTNGEPHNHNDVASFVAVKDGRVILCDLGAGEYTREYFSDERYNIFCTRSSGHSVPIVGGCEQKTGAEYGAYDFKACETAAEASIEGAYKVKALKSCTRRLDASENAILLTDTYITDAPIEITERFITRHKASAVKDGVKILAENREIARLICEGNCKITEYPHREHSGAEITVTAIDFIFKADGQKTFKAKLI